MMEQDAMNSDNSTELHLAINHNQPLLVRKLLEEQIDVHSVDSIGDTPLHLAARIGNVEIAEDLLKYNANVNAVNNYKLTPLVHAAEFGNTNIAAFLLNNGAFVEGVIDDNDDVEDIVTPLGKAVINGHLEMTNLLLKYGAKTEIGERRLSPLHIACTQGHYSIVQTLLNFGSNINRVNALHGSPLHISVQGNRIEIVECLLKSGAFVNCIDKDKNSPLHIACFNKNLKYVDLLLQYGADVECRNERNDTPLHTACEIGAVLIIPLLLKYGANPNVVNSRDETPTFLLTLFVFYSRKEELPEKFSEGLNSLLKANSDLDIPDQSGRTPLMVAASQRHFEVTRSLLEHGADTDLQTTESLDTALHFAFSRQSWQTVKLLLSYGVNINIKNRSGTPITYFNSEIINKHIGRYVLMLHRANIYVNQNDLFSMMKRFEPHEIAMIYERCDDELISIKYRKIGTTSVTLYDILHKSIDQISNYGRNPQIVKHFSCFSKNGGYKVYGQLIKNKFTRAYRRYLLFDEGSKLLYSRSRTIGKLPLNYVEDILHYLQNTDFRNLIEACKGTHNEHRNLKRRYT